MQNNKEFLGSEPIKRLLFKLAIPTVTAQLINMLYNIVDRIFIGHLQNEGSLALTGVGVCMPIIMIVSAFASLISAGGAPRASIFMGKKDYVTAEKILGGCFVTQIVISTILTTVLLIWNKDLLLAFGASGNTITYANEYMSIYAIGTIFVQLTLGMNAFVTAQGFTMISMVSVIIGAITNIILDPILIFGFNMGVKGAALATIISQSISCVWVVSFLIGKKTILKLKLNNMRFSGRIVLPCIALGTATFVMQSSESVISVCFNSSLLKYGGDVAVGAMTILTSVMQFALLPIQGLGQGAQPITSYNYGANNIDRVRKTFKMLVSCSLIYSMIFCVIIMLFPSVFARLFTTDITLISFTSRAMRCYFLAVGIFGIQVACQATFNALGNATASIIVAVLRKFVLLIPLIYIMPNLMSDKTMAVYFAEPVADVIAVSLTSVIFKFQFKNAIMTMEASSKSDSLKQIKE